jgi:hypothetical protein
MRKYTQIQSFFWSLANYNTLYMKFCNTLFNNVSGIGLIFCMQISISFFSVFILSMLFSFNWLFSCASGAVFVSFLIFYIKKSITFLSNTFSKTRLFILFSCAIIGSFIITLPFLLKIFQSQIEYISIINEGKLNLTNKDKIWKLPYGLYNLWFHKENGQLVFIVSTCLYSLMLFIFFYPYSLIFKNKTTLYYKILKLYEERYIKEQNH